MISSQTYDRLCLTCHTADQHLRTGYWYALTSNGTAHTAFRTQEALLQWLEDRGLELNAALPETGSHAFVPVAGAYRSVSHLSYDGFYATRGQRTRVMSNAQYTLAIISADADGLRSVHHLNCNCPDRPTYSHEESRQLEDAGTPPS